MKILKDNKGFTLLQVAIVIIALTSLTIIMAGGSSILAKTKAKSVQADIETVASRVDAYFYDTGTFPEKGQTIGELSVTSSRFKRFQDYMVNEKGLTIEEVNERFFAVDIDRLNQENYKTAVVNKNLDFVYDKVTGQVIAINDDLSYDGVVGDVPIFEFNPTDDFSSNTILIEVGSKKMDTLSCTLSKGNAVIAGGKGDVKLAKIVNIGGSKYSIIDLTSNLPSDAVEVYMMVDLGVGIEVAYTTVSGTKVTTVVNLN